VPGLIPGTVRQFPRRAGLRVPPAGTGRGAQRWLLDGIGDEPYAYFVLLPAPSGDATSPVATMAVRCAVVRRNNVCGCNFLERSAAVGARLRRTSGSVSVEIIPIDRAGGVVRLAQGDYAPETRYPVEPPNARAYAATGALATSSISTARVPARWRICARSKRSPERRRIQPAVEWRRRWRASLFDAGVARVVVGSVAVSAGQRRAMVVAARCG
jgi:hypothetical protein